MVGLGIRVTTGFQQVRAGLSGTTNLKNIPHLTKH